ncbi:HugZ family protein [Paraburkholderia silviterrae]|uniref:Pyridoxamine 5'-phosphate oxidase n=1 Tax=Paraburkholderia silviterrae TaxID=2528715 RepID=A0A4R5MBG2_9BURK|nr:pyridoxamine 5'-phosphate oxidase family protein [Paraburkholderia silviterrae]TDG24138.1 pyridoxamine 5'-phosphate oxidase [Paraburkholderia silviterrae]
MKIPAHAPLHLLHQTSTGTLATHTREPQGFPYPTLLPFAPDARHRPVILVSRLAEHTRNLQDDPRAGFLVAQLGGEDVLNAPRMTLLGLFEPSEAGADAQAPLARRYLRYHPDAARYLALGDFTFWTMRVERLRYIAGFGAMGWLDGADLDTLDPLAADEEDALIRFFEAHPARRDGLALLGVDRYGADLSIDGVRTRYVFEAPQGDTQSLHAVLADCLARHAT